ILTQQSPLPKTPHTSATSVLPEPTSHKPKPTSGKQYSKHAKPEIPGRSLVQHWKPPAKPPTNASDATSIDPITACGKTTAITRYFYGNRLRHFHPFK